MSGATRYKQSRHAEITHRQGCEAVMRFTLNGASDPTVFGGPITEVQVLAQGGVIFFRVTLNHSVRLTRGTTVLTLGVEGADITDDLTVMAFMGAGLTDDGADVFEPLRDIDVVVKDAGIAVNTAGIVVHMDLKHDRATRA